MFNKCVFTTTYNVNYLVKIFTIKLCLKLILCLEISSDSRSIFEIKGYHTFNQYIALYSYHCAPNNSNDRSIVYKISKKTALLIF